MCPQAPICSLLPEAVPTAAGKAEVAALEYEDAMQWFRQCSNSQFLHPQHYPGVPFLLSSSQKHLLSLKLDVLPQARRACLHFELDRLKQGLGVKILAPPKSNCPALAATIPAEPALPAGFPSSVALSSLLLFIPFRFSSYPFLHNINTKSWGFLLSLPSPQSQLCSSPGARESMSRNTGPPGAAWNPLIF